MLVGAVGMCVSDAAVGFANGADVSAAVGALGDPLLVGPVGGGAGTVGVI